MTKVKIANCRKASLRKAPWITSNYKDVIGEIQNGEVIEIDELNFVYDWTDRKFYKAKTVSKEGWIYEGTIEPLTTKTRLTDRVNRHLKDLNLKYLYTKS